MKRNPTAPVWPFVIIVIALFVFCVRAPRCWEDVAVRPLQMNGLAVVTVVTDASLAEASAQEVSDGYTPPVGVRPLVEHDLDPVPSASVTTLAEAKEALDRLAAPATKVKIQAPITRQHAPDGVARDVHEIVIPPASDDPSDEVESLLTASLGLANAGMSLQNTPEITMPALPTTSPKDSRELAYWPYPEALAAALVELEQHSCCSAWCADVLDDLAKLPTISGLASPEARQVVLRLEAAVTAGTELADGIKSEALRSEMRRAVYALSRRTDIWSGIPRVLDSNSQTVVASVQDESHLGSVVRAADRELKSAEHAELWRKYLMIDEAKAQLAADAGVDTETCRELARQVLLRMDYSALTPRQRAFLTQGEILHYITELQHVAAEPVDYLQLLKDLEQFESTKGRYGCDTLCKSQRMLRWSGDERVATLGRQLDAHYRNANFRITVSKDLITRLLPPQEPMTEPVNEVIMGTQTYGCSEVSAELGVDLIPTEGCWRVGVQAKGTVESETRAERGILTFYNSGLTRFETSKPVQMDGDGVHHDPAATESSMHSQLTGLETPFDPIPILSDLVRAIVIQQYEKRAPQAEAEASRLLARRTNQRVDCEVATGIEQATERFQKHVLDPLHNLALFPTALEMRTTPDALVARYRLAGNGQMAAFTPRPRAPEDALLSVQLHESAFNNAFQQLGWGGERKNIMDLYADLAERFQLDEQAIPEDIPDDLYIRFPSENGIRFRFDEGRATIRLAIAELSQGRSTWRNFIVQVHYQPVPEDPTVDLAREQYVELLGRRLHLRDQIALRAIFSRVFAKGQPLDLISRQLREDSRLRGLELGQMQLEDGWLGFAITPGNDSGRRIASRDIAPPRR